ncbi:hypothetical protein PRZ48_011299 [Zasmidium cellare]|uniref:L-ornithine N(5)-monooxygenase [NAD(P)H] n=1 Tax=Zasmidium cellare TaxID=395010 RepID=A0ABR0E5Z3_ZASCE|nr:hypothetical protein PRZ48_011299 [Zasmidium cellare]
MSVETHEPKKGVSKQRSFERRPKQSEQPLTYDLVCVGFGQTALPLAVNLADQDPSANILFVERNSHWEWQSENVLPGRQIGSSFLRDLVTTQNPRSPYTFMNFLHATNQLIRFANNSRLAPSRRLMGQYFRWAAEKIQHLGWVHYGQEATQISPVKAKSQNKVAEWSIQLRSSNTSSTPSTILAKRVIVATGSQPYIPESLAPAPLVLHSSATNSLLSNLHTVKQSLNIAIIGSNQEAAELFEHLSSARQGSHTATLFYPDSALRPADETHSVQDMLERPESMPGNLPPEVRERLHGQQMGGAQGPKVDLHTLEALYERQYTQKIHERDSSKWRFQMKALSEVVSTQRDGERVRLVIKNPRTGETSISEKAFNVVIAATGYNFNLSKELVDVPAALLDAGAVSVDREYHVNFRRDTLVPGCGMWLLGSLEDRNARSDDFRWMAERARRAVKSICREMEADKKEQSGQQQYGERAMF